MPNVLYILTFLSIFLRNATFLAFWLLWRLAGDCAPQRRQAIMHYLRGRIGLRFHVEESHQLLINGTIFVFLEMSPSCFLLFPTAASISCQILGIVVVITLLMRGSLCVALQRCYKLHKGGHPCR